MKKIIFLITVALVLASGPGFALDQYPGDTAIYGVSTATIQPNVLVILDNSGSMSDSVITGDPYDSATTYPETNGCQGQPCSPDKVYRWRGVEQHWVNFIDDVHTISCTTARTSLLTEGTYQGVLKTNGTCSGPSSNSFAIGNYVNWLSQSGGTRTKMEVAKEVLGNLLNTTNGVKFGLMIFNNVNGGHITGVGDSYGYLNYDAYVKDMDTVFTGTTTNREALVNTINNVSPTTWTPLAETLFEGMRYFQGGQTAFNGSYTYTSPIEYSCQNNYVILITDGMSTEDRSTLLKSICNNGDCDGDGFEPYNDPTKDYSYQGSDYLDDVAKYTYDNDMLTDSESDAKTTGKQNIITYTVGFGLAGQPSAERLLEETAYNGGGIYYSASSTAGLSESLRQILATIVEDNTSFVAPVLPVSPENRTFSGDRLYMGFFKPKADAFWSGNLKKYGFDLSGGIVDKNGDPATNADGSLRDNAISYWSTSADGADVEEGGAGALLLTRVSARNIYTYTGSSLSLSDSTNAFTTSNAAITYTTLDVADAAEKDNLIDFVHGLDAYDDDGNGVTSENRDWMLGDILHSKPLVVNYSTFTYADEGDCLINKSIVFVGANDGMLHAFKDCDGSEAWAFIPQDQLPYLKHMPGATHTYFVDSSPSAYTYDADGDGNIEPLNGDKVILIFGERRGGGYYYALDVTDPTAPQYMWRLSSTESPSGTHTDYSELSETWSEPIISKVYVDVGGGVKKVKVVSFVGAGYDDTAEDAVTPLASTTGRGVYAVEVATLNSGVPSFTDSGHKVWGYTHADNASLARSFPTQLSVLDLDNNGYADRIYAGDTGGNLWRFNTGDTDVGNWTGVNIFASNPGADSSTGRKMFYRPSVTLEVGYEMLFAGTGDRAHPLDTSVVDRLYAIKDTGQSTPVTESGLTDATSTATVNIAGTYGWYIKLSTNSGEKVLANTTVLNKVAYYTTFTPSAGTGSICSNDNRGTSRFYALGYLDAGPAYNYNLGNDTYTDVVKDTTDRSTTIGTGIASGMVTVISPNGVSAIVGSGGALVTPPVDNAGVAIPLYWREVR